MCIEGAIFDVDGTLLDSMGIWETIGEDYLRSLGIEPQENLTEVFKTMSLSEAAIYYQNNYNVALSIDKIIHGVNTMIADFYCTHAQLKIGVYDFLTNLSRNNVKMCIATSSERELVTKALERCDILKFFSTIYTCGEIRHSKREPYIYHKALEGLGTSKSKTAVFEDAFFALRTAKQDGFCAIGIYDKNEKEQKRLIDTSDYYITDFSDFNSFWKFASR